jgi:hypothetical protein
LTGALASVFLAAVALYVAWVIMVSTPRPVIEPTAPPLECRCSCDGETAVLEIVGAEPTQHER